MTERVSVSNLSGHSSATTKQFYLLRDRQRDARNCEGIGGRLFGGDDAIDDIDDDSDDASGDEEEDEEEEEEDQGAYWGSEHPSPRGTRRAEWTEKVSSFRLYIFVKTSL